MNKYIFLIVLIAFSISCSQADSFPDLNIEKFGSIIGIWENGAHRAKGKKRYIVITDKNVFLEYWKEDGMRWKDINKTEIPNLVKTGANSYVFRVLWKADWNKEWQSLTNDEKLHFGTVEQLRIKSVIFYVIDNLGNLGEGSYTVFKNAPNKITMHIKYIAGNK